jgi:TPR repeat protein
MQRRAALALATILACRRDPPPRPSPSVDAAVARPSAAADAGDDCASTDLPRCRALALLAIERRDDTAALRLARKGCDGGHLLGCRTLGWLHENGRGTPRDPAVARTLYLRACDGGELGSCKSLGFLFDTGIGGTVDRARAAALYTRACDGGELDACGNLANLYLGGDGVARDYDRAIALYDRVCTANHSERACGNARALRANRDGGVPDARAR